MATISQALAIAVQHHQAGRLQAAEQIYRQILAVEPNHADAWHLLGVIADQVGKHEVAIEFMERAIGLEGNAAVFHNSLAGAYGALRRIPEAFACYHRALELKPDYAEVHNNLGVALNDQGKPDESLVCCRRALELKPDFAEAHYNLGNALKAQGKLDEAVACYRRALQLKPDYAKAHNNLGVTLNDQGKPDEAVACCRRARELKPDFAEAHYNLGNALKARGNLDEAVACYRRALELKPDFAKVYNNLGVALGNQGSLDEAIACCRRALELKPDFADPHNNLGVVLNEQGRLDEAVACYHRALELEPDYAEAHSNLGAALLYQGKLDEAVTCYRRTLELRPDHATSLGSLVHALQHLCCWEDLKAPSQRVTEIVDGNADGGTAFPISPFTFLTLPATTTAEQQLRSARQWLDRRLKAINEPGRSLARRRAVDLKSKTTIGYLSADFHSHATAWLIAELFEKHDRRQFEVFGYSYGPDDGSPMRRRLIEAFDRFSDLRDASFLESAQRIAADGVDILVDLKGYTQNARTQILALRPAPIQVNYLGYPGTMGAPFMDYILVDDFVVPGDQQPFFTEKLVHLPGCYQVNDSQREISAQTPSRAECGLPEEGFVFCSFNNSYKITPEMFDAWMGLLKAVSGSVLWLLEGNRFAPCRPVSGGGGPRGGGAAVGVCAAYGAAGASGTPSRGRLVPRHFPRERPHHGQRRPLGGLSSADDGRGELRFPRGRQPAAGRWPAGVDHEVAGRVSLAGAAAGQ
jgi:predicted O-linked N-acetylglucosamine transferase (SPINDLY family)